MPIRATSSNSAAPDVKRGELIQAAISARPASNLLVSPAGIFTFLYPQPDGPGVHRFSRLLRMPTASGLRSRREDEHHPFSNKPGQAVPPARA
jgi:hypothetical protein